MQWQWLTDESHPDIQTDRQTESDAYAQVTFFLVRQTDRQTDARRRIRAHRLHGHRWAQKNDELHPFKGVLLLFKGLLSGIRIK